MSPIWLNKPFNFILYHFAAGLGDTVIAFAGNLVIGSAVVWLMAGPPPGLAGWLLAVIAVVMAWLLDFCFSALIGLSAIRRRRDQRLPLDLPEAPARTRRPAHPARLLSHLATDRCAQPALRLDQSTALPDSSSTPAWPRLGAVLTQQAIWLAVFGCTVWLIYRWAVARLVRQRRLSRDPAISLSCSPSGRPTLSAPWSTASPS